MNSGMRILILIALAAFAFAAVQPLHGQTETVLYSFCSLPNCADGSGTNNGSLVRDAKGNLYGTTAAGGANNLGTVFELSPTVGGYTETVLHSFAGGTADGSTPLSGLLRASNGTLYGTTEQGGSFTSGTAFALAPPAKKGGAWTETILHNFGASGDGALPQCTLVKDKLGNLYGTTYTGGGTNAHGTVFELSPSGTQWTETIIHTFLAGTEDGLFPESGVVFHGVDLYGTTFSGGDNYGTVYELVPSGGVWTEKFVYSFQQSSGSYFSYALPVFDKLGNLYGTTEGFYGSVFKLTKKQVESPVFLFELIEGGFPGGVLLIDADENLYGTTATGGPSGAAGIVFKLTLDGNLTTLYTFGESSVDGANPNGGLVVDKAGNLYGTTSAGGTGAFCTGACGTVFELTP